MKTQTEINEKIQQLFKEVDILNKAKEEHPIQQAKLDFAEDAITRLNQIQALQWVMIEGVHL